MMPVWEIVMVSTFVLGAVFCVGAATGFYAARVM